jgi:AraC-like DNA-binding protein
MMLRGASGGSWEPEAVHFTHSAPKDRAAFEAFFRAPLEFASRFNGLSCTTESLNLPLPRADRAMALNARRLLRPAEEPGEQAPMSDRAKQAIVLLLSNGRVTLGGVAAQLNLTARSLQRSLEAEGRTFGGLLNEVRRELAQQYLAGSQRLTWISDELGYATLSSFSRWFRNEFGTTPSEWREAQGSAAVGPPALWRV